MKVEDGHPGLDLGGEAAPVQQLTLERGEETLTEGVVPRYAVPNLVGVQPTDDGRGDSHLVMVCP
jgi:hypothetical protein